MIVSFGEFSCIIGESAALMRFPGYGHPLVSDPWSKPVCYS